MITSKSNAKIKEILLLHQSKHRRTQKEYFVEGVRLLEEALKEPEQFRMIVYSPRLERTIRGAELLSSARQKIHKAEWLYASDEVLSKISDTKNHQGILALLKTKERSLAELLKREGLILLLAGLQDPGNLGAIFRVAEAGGAAGLILSRETTDPYNPKVVRASMGSIFRLPFLADQDIGSCLEKLRSRGYQLWASSARGQRPYGEVDFSKPSAVLFGQEGAGLPNDLLAAAEKSFFIPMLPGVDSLNVAMAAGLVVYEALRQRRNYQPKRG